LSDTSLSHLTVCSLCQSWKQSWSRSGRTGPVEKVNWAGRDRNFTGWNFWKISSFDPFLAIKTKISHIFSVGFVKKLLKTHVILIICSKVHCKKIDYVQCLLHGLLKYLIFSVMFSINCFSKEFAIFSPVSPVGHVIPTGRTGPVYHFPTGSSSGWKIIDRKLFHLL
jgi:hypothetical protein